MRILDFIYKRYKPENKLRLISEMSNNDLDAITEEQIQLLLMDAGERVEDYKKVNGKLTKFKTHRGKLTFDSDLTPGNECNSSIDSIFEGKDHHIKFEVYVQGDDIDETCYISFADAKRYREWGTVYEEFRNGYKHTVPANYDDNDFRNVIRCLLYQSVLTKYKLKFSDYFTGTTHGYHHKPLELKKEFQAKDPYKEYTVYRTKLITDKFIIKAKTEKEARDKASQVIAHNGDWVSNEVKYRVEKNGD